MKRDLNSVFELRYEQALSRLEAKGNKGTLLIKYHSEIEYCFYQEDEAGMHWLEYNRMLAYFYKQLTNDGYEVSIIGFDPVSYEEWLAEMPVAIGSSTDPLLMQAWALTQYKAACEEWGLPVLAYT